MANERTYAILPCKELDESITFYETLGFTRTYRQLRPNPYAVVALEDIQIHLAGIDEFNPQDSYGSVIIAVPDPDGLYRDFASKLWQRYGKLPVAGIPRITRLRKKSCGRTAETRVANFPSLRYTTATNVAIDNY